MREQTVNDLINAYLHELRTWCAEQPWTRRSSPRLLEAELARAAHLAWRRLHRWNRSGRWRIETDLTVSLGHSSELQAIAWQRLLQDLSFLRRQSKTWTKLEPFTEFLLQRVPSQRSWTTLGQPGGCTPRSLLSELFGASWADYPNGYFRVQPAPDLSVESHLQLARKTIDFEDSRQLAAALEYVVAETSAGRLRRLSIKSVAGLTSELRCIVLHETFREILLTPNALALVVATPLRFRETPETRNFLSDSEAPLCRWPKGLAGIVGYRNHEVWEAHLEKQGSPSALAKSIWSARRYSAHFSALWASLLIRLLQAEREALVAGTSNHVLRQEMRKLGTKQQLELLNRVHYGEVVQRLFLVASPEAQKSNILDRLEKHLGKGQLLKIWRSRPSRQLARILPEWMQKVVITQIRPVPYKVETLDVLDLLVSAEAGAELLQQFPKLQPKFRWGMRSVPEAKRTELTRGLSRFLVANPDLLWQLIPTKMRAPVVIAFLTDYPEIKDLDWLVTLLSSPRYAAKPMLHQIGHRRELLELLLQKPKKAWKLLDAAAKADATEFQTVWFYARDLLELNRGALPPRHVAQVIVAASESGLLEGALADKLLRARLVLELAAVKPADRGALLALTALGGWGKADPAKLPVESGEALKFLPGLSRILSNHRIHFACLELACRLGWNWHPLLLSLFAQKPNDAAPGTGFDEHYRTYTIPKKDGKRRKISEPAEFLKALQRVLLDKAIAQLVPHRAATGFRSGYSIVDNARPHEGQRVVVKVDIESFFPSTRYGAILGAVSDLWGGSLSPLARHFVAELCSQGGALPIGAPTSPALGNYILMQADRALSTVCDRLGVVYTRFADDLTLSSQDEGAPSLLPFVSKVLKSHGYRLAHQKTGIFRRGRRQTVTGLVVNEKATLARDERRRLRAMVDAKKKGKVVMRDGQPISDATLRGHLAFLRVTRPKEADTLLAKLAGS